MKYTIKFTMLLTTLTLVSCDKIPFMNKQLSQPEKLTFVAKKSGTPKNYSALNRLAQQTMVEIVSEGYLVGDDKYILKGSGVIIGRKDFVYYVLTANHIFNMNDIFYVFIRSKKLGKAGEVTGLKFINRYPQEDLALIAFASFTNYRVMELGDVSQLDDNNQVYVAGWPGYDNRENFQFTRAKVTNSQMGNNLTYKPIELENGLYKGMSGGAVLNEAGQLVGIHLGLTKVDEDREGVLISTFLRMVSPEVKDILERPTFLIILQAFVLLLLACFFFIVFDQYVYPWKKIWKKKKTSVAILPLPTREDQTITKFLIQNAESYFNQGLKYRNQRKYDLAIAEFNQAIKLNPKYAEAYYNRGNIYNTQGKYDLALVDYNQAIKFNPKYTQVYNNKGIIYNKQGKYDLALAEFNQAIKLNPKYSKVYNNRGIVYNNQRKYDLAIAEFNQAIKLNPKYAEAYYNRGNIYNNQGKYDLALAEFNQAIKFKPKYAKAYYNRGLVYKTQRNIERVISDFEKAAKLYKEQQNQRWYQNSLDKLKKLQHIYSEQEKSEKGQVFTFEVVRLNNSGNIISRTQGRAQQKIEHLGNDIKLEIVYIPGGSFLMGSPTEEVGRYSDEGPQHRVTLQPFYMSKYPITQDQYQVIMGNNPSRFRGGRCPVETVSWHDATEFCEKLSQKTGRDYRLPSESQWEYACRAGTTTPFYFGETITPDFANYYGNSSYGNGPKGKYRQQTTYVGIFPPNAFGLYDMHGNVWEWCADEWHDNYDGAPTDGSVWLDGNKNRSPLRGGSWVYCPYYCRSAIRSLFLPRDVHNYDFGFRVVCNSRRTF